MGATDRSNSTLRSDEALTSRRNEMAGPHVPKDFRRVIIAAAVGNVIEWYDFYIFGSLAAVLSVKFFEQSHPVAALLSTIALFTAGFLIRPLGAFLFGWMGDRVGRKYTFLLTLTGMGIGTGAIGLIPTYAEIGLTAAFLLFGMRMIQGLCLGGEYGGAITYVAEHVPDERPRLLHRLATDLADARHRRLAGRNHRLAHVFWQRSVQRVGVARSVPGVLPVGSDRNLDPAPTPGDTDLRGDQGQGTDGEEPLEGSLRAREYQIRPDRHRRADRARRGLVLGSVLGTVLPAAGFQGGPAAPRPTSWEPRCSSQRRA